jgi:hypothetical protein
MQDLTQTKICVEKIGEEDKHKFRQILYGSQSELHGKKLQAAYVINKIWKPNYNIKIGFINDKEPPRTPITPNDKDVDPLALLISDKSKISAKDAVKKVVIERIVPIVNLNIEFVDDINEANVRITFNQNEGSWSYVGNDCLQYKDPKEATMNFGWLDAATILHEFGHCIGAFIHEHQSPFGKGIDWDDKKVFSWASQTQGWDEETTKENILDRYNKTTVNGTMYDPYSIMLYFFPGNLTKNGVGTKQNSKLSGYDAQLLNSMYKIGAPESVEKFYQRVYGTTIEESIKQSESRNKESSSQNTGFDFNILWIIAVLILGIGVFLYIFSDKNRIQKRRKRI